MQHHSSGRGAAADGAAAGTAAAGWEQCGSSDVEADVQERLDVGLHAVMLVLRAVKERGT